MNRIIKGDCLQVMTQLETGSVDAVITDPPFCSGSVSEAGRTAAAGQGLRSENIKKFGWFKGDNMGTAGLVWLIRAVCFEACRVMKPTGSVLIFCDWRMLPNLVPAVESAGLRYQNLVVWNKTAMGLGRGFRAQHELIIHATAGDPEYFDLGTGNVLNCKRVRADEREHQTEKPVDLIAQLVRVVCPPGGVVLDPFAGSCTTAEACASVGRDCICIEREEEHCRTGEERLREIQPSLL